MGIILSHADSNSSALSSKRSSLLELGKAPDPSA